MLRDAANFQYRQFPQDYKILDRISQLIRNTGVPEMADGTARRIEIVETASNKEMQRRDTALNHSSWLPFLSLFLIALLVEGCTRTHRMSTFDPKGPVANMQLNLFYVTLAVVTFLFLTVGGTLIFTILRFREKPGDESRPMPAQSHGNPILELTLIAFSCLCLVIIAVPTVRGIWMMEELPRSTNGEVLEINVTGYQWWWAFDYPDLDITTANELVIPKDTTVKLNLRTVDVIHSFWLPKLAGKVDLMPGRANWMWLLAEEEGHYYGQCAEYCGEAHAYMLLRSDVLNADEWQRWVSLQQSGAAPPLGTKSWPEFLSKMDHAPDGFPDHRVQDGARLFLKQGGCVQCHTLRGAEDAQGIERATGILGPNLTHVASRKSIGAGIIDNRGPDDVVNSEIQLQNFHRWIRESESFKPGNLMYRQVQTTMQQQALTDHDLGKIAAFLQTLR